MMYQFLQEYLDTIKKFYLVSMESAIVNTVEESNKINSWVENKQMKKYQGPIFWGFTLPSWLWWDTVYFKGQWNQDLDKENMEEGES